MTREKEHGAARVTRAAVGERHASRTSLICWTILAAGSAGGALLSGGAPVRAEDVGDAIRITEVLALNDGGLADEDGDHSDWLEIENLGAAPVSLGDWHLTDDPADLRRWRLPALDLLPGEFLIVFASGKSRAQAAAELHASFRLDGGGEYLALVLPDGETIVDEISPAYPPQRPDVSWGLMAGGQAFLYFPEPTPGAPNAGPGFEGFVGDTRCSRDRGFFDAPFPLEITTATAGARIRYTLDGSPPSTTTGAEYTTPLLIASSTVLRAAAFLDGFLPSRTITHTYIFLDDVIAQDDAAALARGLPATWGETPADYAMDPDVIGADGVDLYDGRYAAAVREGLLSLPALSLVAAADDIFGPEGIYTLSTATEGDPERPVSVELIHPDGADGFQVDAGLRLQGGAFRSHELTRKHSLRLVFRKSYGAAALEHPLFGRRAARRFDTLTLRAGANDSWQWATAGEQGLYIRDSFARETLLDLGGIASHEIFVHLYLNGVYWGLYNVVERPDASFCASYFGGDKEDWDAIHNGEASSGSRDAWFAMLIESVQGLASDAAYQHIQGNFPDGTDDPELEARVDFHNLIDYLLVYFYAGTRDWPESNYWACRARTESTGFKFFPWDAEMSLGLAAPLDTSRIDVAVNSAAPYAAARGNAEFRLRFADHAHRHFVSGGALHVDSGAPQWDPEHPGRNVPAARFVQLARRIEKALVPESARWGDQHSEPPRTPGKHWAPERDRLLADYFPLRSAVVLEGLRAANLYPPVEAPSFNVHGGLVPRGFSLRITAPAGEVHYTDDGTDPRLPGGGVSPRARIAGAGEVLPLDAPARVRARALVDGEWSALNEAFFYFDIPLRVTEVMYHPRPGAGGDSDPSDFEFVELQNIGDAPLDLQGIRLTGGIHHDLSEISPALLPGEIVVVARSPEAFASRYPFLGVRVAGGYAGSLGNGGDILRLEGPAGEPILDFEYSDRWYPVTDGEGYSLVVTDERGPPAMWTVRDGWRPSIVSDGSPGTLEPPPGGERRQLPGDLNQDSSLDISDGIAILGHLFLGSGPELPCAGAIDEGDNLLLFDTNGDGDVDIADPSHIFRFLFIGRTPPVSGRTCILTATCHDSCR
jgi:hypothetical protein